MQVVGTGKICLTMVTDPRQKGLLHNSYTRVDCYQI